MNKVANYKQSIYKMASDRRKDTDTKLMRDRVNPEISRKVRRLPLETLTDITVGAVAGKAGAKLGGKIGKAMGNSKKLRKMSARALKGVDKVPVANKARGAVSKTYDNIATKLKNNPVKETQELGHKMTSFKHSKKKAEIAGKGIGGAVIGGAATVPFKYQIKNKQEERDYNKLSNKYLGRNINDKEKQAIRARNKKITLGYGSPVEGFKSTPEAMIQKARREKR